MVNWFNVIIVVTTNVRGKKIFGRICVFLVQDVRMLSLHDILVPVGTSLQSLYTL